MEDDCLPDSSFFKFCEELLVKYRNNKKVMHISGDAFIEYKNDKTKSYYFSRTPLIWGWATWRRAWINYKVNLNKWTARDWEMLNNKAISYIDKIYWYLIFNKVANNGINTWDYQWVYAIWNNNGLSIIPNVNLVKNIGFSHTATHTKRAKNILKEVKISRILFPLKHPKIEIDKNRDFELTKRAFNINLITLIYLWCGRV